MPSIHGSIKDTKRDNQSVFHASDIEGKTLSRHVTTFPPLVVTFTMEEPPAKTKLVKPLDEEVSRRICTGQVIISLSGACRELLDNALDAGATNLG